MVEIKQIKDIVKEYKISIPEAKEVLARFGYDSTNDVEKEKLNEVLVQMKDWGQTKQNIVEVVKGE